MTDWRRGWDSNPRDPFRSNGFQDRRLQPLGHPSGLSKFNWQAGAPPTLNKGELPQGAERTNLEVPGVLFCGGDRKRGDSSQKSI
jgi:hypothetical protein